MTGSEPVGCLRLLHQGLNDNSALPFPPEQLASSPLWRAGAMPAWEKRNFFLEYPKPELRAPVYLAGTVTSCLDVAHNLAQQNLLPEWGSVLAEQQSAGRGQLRRTWESPPGNIYATLRLPLQPPFHSGAAAPALGGLTAEALGNMGYRVQMKWPNDILQEQENPQEQPEEFFCWKKVGGILLEERANVLIAGMGFNIACAPPATLLRKNFALPAGCLLPARSKADELVPLLTWWMQLAGEIVSCYFHAIVAKSTGWHALAEKHLALRGCPVRLCEAGTEQCGTVAGLCPSGELRLQTLSGTRTFSGGSLMPVMNMGSAPRG